VGCGLKNLRLLHSLAIFVLLCSTSFAGYKVTGNLEVTGNAGIGTSVPRQTLDVEGSVYVTGNIGIGTLSPVHAVDVGDKSIRVYNTNFGSSTSPGIIKLAKFGNSPTANTQLGAVQFWGMDNGTTKAPRLAASITGWGVGYGSNYVTGDIYFSTNSSSSGQSEKMRLTSTGNLGVGTTAPAGLLDVNRKLTVLSEGNVGIGSATPRAILDVAGANGSKLIFANPNTYSSGVLELRANNNLFGLGVTELFIANDSAPADNRQWYWLAQGSDMYWGLVNDANNSGDNYAHVSRNGASATQFDIMYGHPGEISVTDNGVDIAAPNTGQPALTVNGDTLIASSGNLGIGTTTPRGALDVNRDETITVPDVSVFTVTTDTPDSFHYSYYTDETLIFYAWAYRDVNGTRIYSETPKEVSPIFAPEITPPISGSNISAQNSTSGSGYFPDANVRYDAYTYYYDANLGLRVYSPTPISVPVYSDGHDIEITISIPTGYTGIRLLRYIDTIFYDGYDFTANGVWIDKNSSLITPSSGTVAWDSGIISASSDYTRGSPVLSWEVPAGADGVKLETVVYGMFEEKPSTTTSLIDDIGAYYTSWSADSTVTPISVEAGPDMYTNQVGNLVSNRGASFAGDLNVSTLLETDLLTSIVDINGRLAIGGTYLVGAPGSTNPNVVASGFGVNNVVLGNNSYALGGYENIFAIGSNDPNPASMFITIDAQTIGPSDPIVKLISTVPGISGNRLDLSGSIISLGGLQATGVYIGKLTDDGTGRYFQVDEPTSISNSVVISGNVGIGTTAPTSLFDVNRKFNVLAGGNVGIGTTAPRGKLEVDGFSYFMIGNVGVGTVAARQTLDVDGTVYMKGNVGIGTTAPGALFEIKPSANGNIVNLRNAAGTVFAYADSTNSAWNASYLQIGGGTGGQWGSSSLKVPSSLQFQWSSTSSAVGTPDIALRRYGAGVLEVNNGTSGQLARLIANNVGIGTYSPRGLLEVDTSPYTSPFIITTGRDVGIGTATPRGKLEVDGFSYFMIGNVGINTIAPGYKLEVDGNVYFGGEATVENLSTGSNAGATVCVDSRRRFCLCGSCE
jgi:hypothetical protein